MLSTRLISLIFIIGFLTITSTAYPQAKTAQELVGACARCHGTDGNSSSGQYPSLARQNEEYLIKQLHDFKSGARSNGQMSPLVGVLNDEDIITLAKFYYEEHIVRQRGIDEDLAKIGKDIAKEHGCASCHQANYRGAGPIPRLSRQKRVYLEKTMKDFRDGTRTNDNGLKTTVMDALSDEEVKALSHFLSGM
ncbi:MAG: cytochrome c4 [Burkholderiales bacterium]|nr:cytochrome c4 [Burkholderiales bacterium]